MLLVSCMGGWCSRRESCLHYREGTTQPPAERLCPRGAEWPLQRVPQRADQPFAPARVSAESEAV